MQKSYLTYQYLDNYPYEYVEIGMPYMIMYEEVNMEKDYTVAYEFTEQSALELRSSASLTSIMQKERPLHSHDFYELTIVISGEVTFVIEEEERTYHAGECLLCNKFIHHKELHDSSCSFVLFMLQEEYITSILSNDIHYDDTGQPIPFHNFLTKLFHRNEKNPFYSSKEFVEFRPQTTLNLSIFTKLIDDLLSEMFMKRSGFHYMVSGYFCRFFSIICDQTFFNIETYRARLSKEEQLLFDVSRLIESNRGRISRETIEKKLNYSSDYINRIVKKYTGKSLSDYARGFLLMEAADLLVHTDTNIGDICLSLGYTNRHYFNQMFVKRYGMTPTEYRKLNRK